MVDIYYKLHALFFFKCVKIRFGQINRVSKTHILRKRRVKYCAQYAKASFYIQMREINLLRTHASSGCEMHLYERNDKKSMKKLVAKIVNKGTKNYLVLCIFVLCATSCCIILVYPVVDSLIILFEILLPLLSSSAFILF